MKEYKKRGKKLRKGRERKTMSKCIDEVKMRRKSVKEICKVDREILAKSSNLSPCPSPLGCRHEGELNLSGRGESRKEKTRKKG